MSSAQVTKTIPTLTSASSGADFAARPKIMRRPAQFSSPSPVIIVQAPMLNPPTETNSVMATQSWQDDGRFAIALVVVVVAINLLASMWLVPAAPPHLKPVMTAEREIVPAVTILNEMNPPESYQ